MAWNDIANAYWTFLTWCCGNNAHNVHTIIVFVCIIIILHTAITLGSKLRYMFHWKKSADHRDPRRTFTNAEKERMMAHCGHRCENVKWYGRCRNTTRLAGDHWFPHARGGKTSEKNLVILCQECNSTKSAKLPTWWQTFLITQSRKRYGLEKPGEWQ